MPADDASRRSLEKTDVEPAVAEGDDAVDTGDDPADPPQAKRRRKAPLWLETIVLLAVALGMALIIKTFFVQAFYIPSGSMEPGLVRNDRILVQKVSYWLGGSPSRGDVIVFEDPGGWLTGPETGPQTPVAKVLARIGLYPTGGHLVKRVIGTPGDTVRCCDAEGRLQINGESVDEDDFIRPQPDPPRGCDGPMVNQCGGSWEITVPDDRLFVMGDNRNASADSSARLCRADGGGVQGCDKAFVPMDNVVGKVFALVWPASHAELIGRPDVFEDVPDPS